MKKLKIDIVYYSYISMYTEYNCKYMSTISMYILN